MLLLSFTVAHGAAGPGCHEGGRGDGVGRGPATPATPATPVTTDSARPRGLGSKGRSGAPRTSAVICAPVTNFLSLTHHSRNCSISGKATKKLTRATRGSGLPSLVRVLERPPLATPSALGPHAATACSAERPRPWMTRVQADWEPCAPPCCQPNDGASEASFSPLLSEAHS